MVVIHYLPIEHYPPVINFLNCLEEKAICFTTKSDKYPDSNYSNHSVFRVFVTSSNKWLRIFQYVWFNVVSSFLLFWHRPKSVLYYQPISAFPALLYKLVRGKKVKVAVHYHEYISPEEHVKGMFLNRILHDFERKMYTRLDWISQTNNVRKQLFCRDENIPLNKVNTVANYPSSNWAKKNTLWQNEELLKLVFVGYSVDRNSCYIEETIQWLRDQKIPCILDLYCLEQKSLREELIGQQGNVLVNIHPPVEYQDLPSILKQYHIGLILYRGLTPNYIHNAPNKLFEYLSCGLDVWYPKEMEGIKPYQRLASPKVVEFDFKTLDHQMLSTDMISQANEEKNEMLFLAEEEYKELINFMISA